MAIDAGKRAVSILLVEDNLSDALLIQEAFRKSSQSYAIHLAREGTAALDFLFQRGEHSNATRPDLILLDLNLPGIHGLDVLRTVKQDSELRCIPIIVLTGSSSQEDILSCYDLHANSYIIKPEAFEDYVSVAKVIENFWFSVSMLAA